MALVIRLRRLGARGKPFYRIAVAEKATARDGRFVEELGWYDPKKEGLNSKVNVERVRHWLSKGAKPTDTVRSILKKHGVYGTAPAAAEAPAAEAPAEPEAAAPPPEVAPEPEPAPSEPAPPQEAVPQAEPEQPPPETEKPNE